MKKMLWIFWLLGGLLVFGGVNMGTGSLLLVKNGLAAQGIVIEIAESVSTSRDSKTNREKISRFYYPVVQFRTQDRKTASFTSKLGNGNSSAYEVGQSVDVLYLPENPADAKIKSNMELWFAPCMMAFFGALLLGAGYACKRLFRDDPEELFPKDMIQTFGVPVSANVTDIVQTESPSAVDDLAKQPPWIIHAEWTDPKTGKLFKFSSKPVAKDPRGVVGSTIMVKILPNSPATYDMDIGALSK